MPGVAVRRGAGGMAITTRTLATGADGGSALYSLEAAGATVISSSGAPADDFLAGQDRSWGITVGIEYGALTLRGAQQNRHVANIRLYDQTGVNFDAKNSIAAATTNGQARLPAPRSLPLQRCAPVARRPLCPPSARGGVRILRTEGPSADSQGGRLLISGRMADVCAALNRLAFNEYACG